jgi:hypothetical protein
VNTLKTFLHAAAVLALLLIALSLLPQERASADEKKVTRAYYLTSTTHLPDSALTACAPGFHMASIWEIIDPSNHNYDTTRGFTRGDSGSGPPSGRFGWIRTGFDADGSPQTGEGNCVGWSTAVSDYGAIAGLPNQWPSSTGTFIGPWEVSSTKCIYDFPVWCIESQS